MFFNLKNWSDLNGWGEKNPYLKFFTITILSLHLVWVSVHLLFVSKDLINPWKLGGYGMYTVPHDAPRTHVFLQESTTKRWTELDYSKNKFATRKFEQLNHNNIFKCRFPTERSLAGFIDENPHLRYQPLVIAVSKIVFSRYPIKVERQIRAKIEIAWSKNRESFGYRGQICGRNYSGKVKYS